MQPISLKIISLTYWNRTLQVANLVPQSNKILDAGCSDGYLDSLLIAKCQELHGIDINTTDIQIAKMRNKNAKYQIASIYTLPYKNEFFDTIICVDVLEHLEHDQKAINELFRVLKKGGTLIISVPHKHYPFVFDPINKLLSLGKKHLSFGMWAFGHIRLYSMQSLTSLLKKSHFSIIERKYVSHGIIGLLENSYLINILQPFTKSDPMNQNKETDVNLLHKRLDYQPPSILLKIRDFILFADYLLFHKSKVSINIVVKASK